MLFTLSAIRRHPLFSVCAGLFALGLLYMVYCSWHGLCFAAGIAVGLLVWYEWIRFHDMKSTTTTTTEGFHGPAPQGTEEKVPKQLYEPSRVSNPFGNVLLTDIADVPHRKSALPSFDVDTSEDITRHVKRTVQTLHPDIDNTNQQLFGDLYQQFVLDNSNRVFYSTPNTEVEPGNQAALGKYLYGDMPSAKEDTVVGNLQRIKDNYRYTLY